MGGNGHDDIVHELLQGMGRMEASQHASREDIAYMRTRVDEVCQRLRTVETKTAVHASLVSLLVSAVTANAKAVLGAFGGS
ncbi:MAG: hypothetical protein HQL79_08575 [Magnetococcales bacterium]|nr:hypothetical protein [Magnetococcales bacterium]